MATSMNFYPAGAEDLDDEYDDEVYDYDDGDYQPRKPKVNQAVTKFDASKYQRPKGGFGVPENCHNGDSGQQQNTFPRKGKMAVPSNPGVQRSQKKHSSVHRRPESKSILPVDDYKMAVIRGDVNGIRKYIDQGVQVDCIMRSGWTALMYAGNAANKDTVQALIEAGADVNFSKDQYSVLMATCSSSKESEDNVLDCVDLLITNGAKVYALDRYHTSALIYAAREGKSNVVKRIIDAEAIVNQQDSRGYTALMWAAWKGHMRVVRVMVDAGADKSIQCHDGATAAEIAYTQKHTQIGDYLENKPSSTGVAPASSPAATRKAEPEEQTEGGDVVSSDVISSKYTRYGELELFLCGLGLTNLIPLFQQHQIPFTSFLRFTDHDLMQMGITQLGARKKILDAVRETHKKAWDTNSLTSIQYNKTISCAEAVAMVSNISKHMAYIASTVGYMTDQTKAHPTALQCTQEGSGVTDLVRHTDETLQRVKLLYNELVELRRHSTQVTEGIDYTPPDLLTPEKPYQPFHRRFPVIWTTVGVTACSLILWKRTAIIASFSSLSLSSIFGIFKR